MKRLLLAVLLIGATAGASPLLSSVSPAGAVCHGAGAPFNVTAGSPVWGEENPSSGTCDNLGDYNGKFVDRANNGTCVFISYYKNNVWTNTGANCNHASGVFTNYSFTDTSHDAVIKICKSDLSACTGQLTNNGF
jgi:hypothetical protein